MPTRRTVLALPLLALAPTVATACGASSGAPAPPGPGPATSTPLEQGPVAQAQSPIDLRSGTAPSGLVPDLVLHYPPTVDVEVVYRRRTGDVGCGAVTREETIEAQVPPGAAYLMRGDERFDLEQFHFHTPSEHLVDGRNLPAEQHLVHAGADGRRLVVALFLVGGGRAAPQDRVLEVLPERCAPEPVTVGGVALDASLPPGLNSRHYVGSLTTSPYTGGVEWHVLTTPAAIDDATLARFAALFPQGDNRDVQPLGDRVVDVVGGSRA